MRVYKRGSIYWFELVFEGERVQRSTKTRNQRAAGQIASAFHAALAKGNVGITERKKAPTFKAAMKAFLEVIVATKTEHPSTAARYVVSSKALLRFFSDVPLDKITTAEVERFRVSRLKEKGSRTGRPLRPATVNRETVALGALFRHFKATVPINPVSELELLPERNQEDRVLTFAEQNSYLACATPTLRDVALLMLSTGCRPGEIYSIEAKDVNLSARSLFIPRGKTAAARRRIALTSIAMNVLANRLASHPSGYIFPCETDPSRPIPKLNNAHDRAVRDSGVKRFKLYCFRHTWATRAVEAGIDLVTLAAMLGHARTSMVMRYAHPTQAHQRTAMEKIEQHTAAQEIREFGITAAQ